MHQVRRARPEDAPELAGLIGELGYPVRAVDVRPRIVGLPPDNVVLVAFDGTVLTGWVHGRHGRSVVHGDRLEIVGLGVAGDRRGHGVGRALLTAVEGWARGRGLRRAQVLSGAERGAAHRFYRRHGYRRMKAEEVFVKTLAAG
ncbi:GNAT family N-acetyltransferase [Micromonospora endolithica]|uniref:GNAT family N-acetyltransferase n=1 Tax=Micromonospora endolithica TaxID=230091 RepID=A0A3A9YTP2_9ACTN|nr:GNAT family N-acetyltransferase [Micromonospora endolithica]RKN39330.1 GNAT family N-acetyltransferase [Micromonospora endolithica]TWJ22748.1 N-acetylglutamate synthase-like GNAT family acetyltransferase [Micromonospora endolithica]